MSSVLSQSLGVKTTVWYVVCYQSVTRSSNNSMICRLLSVSHQELKQQCGLSSAISQSLEIKTTVWYVVCYQSVIRN